MVALCIMDYKIKRYMTVSEHIRLLAQIAVLMEIAMDYKGKTIDNIIQQLESRAREVHSM